MAQTVISIAAVLIISVLSDRSEHLKRISNYELIHINVDNPKESLSTLHFTAFGEEYSVELERNDNLIPSNVRHTNGNPQIDAGHHDYFNSQTTSCHYLGKVTNTDKPSLAAISMCDKRGVRGYVDIDNETLVIYPSAYYMDTSKNHHLLEDEHIIYKASDENVGQQPIFRSLPNPHLADFTQKVMDDADEQRRRLQQENGGTNIVEVLLLLEPAIGALYQQLHGNTWYSELTADMTDSINWVSGIYEGTNWRDSRNRDLIGSIAVTIVEFEYISEWTGDYTSLQPSFYSCTNYLSSSCPVDAGDWLDKIDEWMPKYKDLSTFDNFVAVTYKHIDNSDNWDILGIAWLDSMCTGGRSASVNRLRNSLTEMRETIAHEIGHNFGASHDQGHPDGCNTNSGLMGYGSVGDVFSICSKNDFNDYFRAANLGCLAQRETSITPEPTTPAPVTPAPVVGVTPSPITTTTAPPSGCGCDISCYTCFTLSSLSTTWDGHNLNGQYLPSGTCFNDRPLYESTDGAYYMYYDASSASWLIGDSANNGLKAYASGCSDDIRDCSNNWYYFRRRRRSRFIYRLDSTSTINDVCSDCDNCFTDDNVQCLQVTEYGEDVCVYNNDTLFDGYTNFKFMEACAYDKPVWYYSYNINDTNESVTYYLHYDQYYKYQTDEFLSVRWIISERQISIPGIAICEQQHLWNCTENSWIVTSHEFHSDLAQSVIDEGMAFYNVHCDEAQGLVTDDDDKSVDAVLITCIVLAVCAVFVAVAVFLMCRSDKKRRDTITKSNSEKSLASVSPKSAPTPDDNNNGEEPEIVYEIETQQNVE